MTLNLHKIKTFLNGFFINFLIKIWHLGLFYALMENLKIKLNINICLFYLKEKHNK